MDISYTLEGAWATFDEQTAAADQLDAPNLMRARMLFASGYQAGFHAAMHYLSDQARVVQGELLALAQELGVDTYRERANAARH